jgi:3-dehydroquinate dehydratase II
MARILVIQGPNLNLLGLREPEIYGSTTLEELHQDMVEQAQLMGHELDTYQSNSESDIVDQIQAATENIDFIIINPAAFTHTSIAIRDAFLATEIPFIEVHISNSFARERYRQKSYISDLAHGVIMGMGMLGYQLALFGANAFLEQGVDE